MFNAIDHPAISCRDVEGQIDWYCRHLGLRVVAKNDATPPSAILGYGDSATGGTMVELMPVRDAGADPERIGRFAPGLRHLAFRVTDFDEAYAALKSAGVRFLGEAVTALGGGRLISFRDPEGNELQIVERRK
jgi:glyoxylase I family protein